jgi:hypothetical protein
MAFPRVVSPYGPSAAFPRFVTPYGCGSRFRRRRTGLSGLGASLVVGDIQRSCPTWGCGPMPVVRGFPGSTQPCSPGVTVPNATWNQASCQWIPNPTSTGAPSTATTQVSVAGTPVPVGFPTNQIFMAPDGSQWVYSTAQGIWLNEGTPFNLSAASNPPSTSTSLPMEPTAGMTYTDSSGNIWTFNGTSWSITGSAATAAAAAAPANPAIGATYTDASGNIWTYNGSSWQMTTAAASTAAAASGPYNSVLDFLTQENLISGVPNWMVGAGAVLAYMLISAKLSGGRR